MLSSEIERLRKKMENKERELEAERAKSQNYERQIEELQRGDQDRIMLENKVAMLASEVERQAKLI